MTFRELHRPGTPLLMPNAWDAGSARLLASLGFAAIATTSGGFAATLGRRDGDVTREEALAHCVDLVAAVDLPVSADLENGYDDIAATIDGAVDAGLAGCSIEDWDGEALYDIDEATDRVRTAVEANAGRLVLTARAENHFRGVDDLDDTIARLQAYVAAGADVVYAPAVPDVSAVVEAVDAPVNVLAVPSAPPVSELAGLGVARVTVGTGFIWTAYGALLDAATELRDRGTYEFWDLAARGSKAFRDA